MSPLRVSLEDSKVGFKRTADGYQMEVAIPWKIMFLKSLAGYTIGFTMSVNDDDSSSAQYEKQLNWRGRQVCTNTEGWDRLELAEWSPHGQSPCPHAGTQAWYHAPLRRNPPKHVHLRDADAKYRGGKAASLASTLRRIPEDAFLPGRSPGLPAKAGEVWGKKIVQIN